MPGFARAERSYSALRRGGRTAGWPPRSPQPHPRKNHSRARLRNRAARGCAAGAGVSASHIAAASGLTRAAVYSKLAMI
jgi:hypothetical protein